jgi:hypothetical protein
MENVEVIELTTMIDTPMIYKEQVEFERDVTFYQDVTFMGKMTSFSVEEINLQHTIHKDVELKTKWDLFKALFGILPCSQE